METTPTIINNEFEGKQSPHNLTRACQVTKSEDALNLTSNIDEWIKLAGLTVSNLSEDAIAFDIEDHISSTKTIKKQYKFQSDKSQLDCKDDFGAKICNENEKNI